MEERHEHDEKLTDLCLYCGTEPDFNCYFEHKVDIVEVWISNVLTPEEFEQWCKNKVK